jgi:hypothetical protein
LLCFPKWDVTSPIPNLAVPCIPNLVGVDQHCLASLSLRRGNMIGPAVTIIKKLGLANDAKDTQKIVPEPV